MKSKLQGKDGAVGSKGEKGLPGERGPRVSDTEWLKMTQSDTRRFLCFFQGMKGDAGNAGRPGEAVSLIFSFSKNKDLFKFSSFLPLRALLVAMAAEVRPEI